MTEWRVMLWHCITPLHNGSGQGLGAIDRPVIREVASGLPFVQGSSLKGALRALVKQHDSEVVAEELFGKGGTEGWQGAVTLTDASLLLLPVRSLAGTFLWATSPLLLARLTRALGIAGDSVISPVAGPVVAAASSLDPGEALGASFWYSEDDPRRTEKTADWDRIARLDATGPYCLESLVLDPVKGEEQRAALARLASRLGQVLFDKDGFWPGFMRGRLIVVSDQDLDHLAGTATQVEANIAIEETGVTKDGSLRYTEFLSPETVLFSLMEIGDSLKPKAKDVNGEDRGKEGGPGVAPESTLGKVLESPIQLGADETTGKGIVRCVLVTPATETKVPSGGAMPLSLDHRRAAFATRRLITERFGEPPSEQLLVHGASLAKYRSVVLSAGVYLRECGLLQLVAFWLSKAKNDTKGQSAAAETAVLEDLVSWLVECEVTRGLCTASDERTAVTARPVPEQLCALVERSALHLSLLERESLAMIGWLKRVAEGLYKSRPHPEES